MALLSMCFHDTEENKKTITSGRCLESLANTVDLTKHRLFLIDNASNEATKKLLESFSKAHPNVTVITNETNIGTAEAINLGWKSRFANENALKIDNDVVWHSPNWVDLMEECIARDPNIGIVGLKRKDLCEKVTHPNEDYRSELIQLPQNAGEKWLVVERARHIIGTVQLYNHKLLEKIGYLYQPNLYGYDDVLASWRSHVAGFKNVFLFQVEIDHIDEGNTPYQGWKERHAGEVTQEVIRLSNGYLQGTEPIFYSPFK
jgi:GT2 family glycosyltransferase